MDTFLILSDFHFPKFYFGNYVLRNIQKKDICNVFAALSHPDVIAHYGVSYKSLDATTEQMLWYEQLIAEHKGIWWGIAKREGDELIGACGFNDWLPVHRRIELGYWLLPEYWRQGIMRAALPAILRYAFLQMSVHRVHADVEPENLASSNLLRTLGFVHEGTLRDVEYLDERYVSLHQFSLVSTDPAALALKQF